MDNQRKYHQCADALIAIADAQKTDGYARLLRECAEVMREAQSMADSLEAAPIVYLPNELINVVLYFTRGEDIQALHDLQNMNVRLVPHD